MEYQLSFFFFFFNAPANTEIYTLSLHDALPISRGVPDPLAERAARCPERPPEGHGPPREIGRAHSELQSPYDLVCRLLLEKKKPQRRPTPLPTALIPRTSPTNLTP